MQYCVTVSLAWAVPAVNVTTPVRELVMRAQLFCLADSVIRPPLDPDVADSVSHDWFDDAVHLDWFVVTVIWGEVCALASMTQVVCESEMVAVAA